jgi:hypothetical protein
MGESERMDYSSGQARLHSMAVRPAHALWYRVEFDSA